MRAVDSENPLFLLQDSPRDESIPIHEMVLSELLRRPPSEPPSRRPYAPLHPNRFLSLPTVPLRRDFLRRLGSAIEQHEWWMLDAQDNSAALQDEPLFFLRIPHIHEPVPVTGNMLAAVAEHGFRGSTALPLFPAF
jgi:hypothetical protein